MENETPKSKSGGQNFWVEFGPVAIFVLAYQYLMRTGHDDAIFTASAIFMVFAVVALVYSRVSSGKFAPMLSLSTALIVIFVGLAYLFNDDFFIKVKPTIVYILFGLAVIGGAFLKKNLIKIMMGAAIEMPEKAWNVMAIRWGIFFFVLAAINEVVWRNFTEEFWVNFKLFGFFPITLIFAISQAPFMMRNGKIQED